METTRKFETGQRVITPQGEGEILTAGSLNIEVRLDTGEIRSYTSDQLSDDSDAG
jgi:hypothetical protein